MRASCGPDRQVLLKIAEERFAAGERVTRGGTGHDNGFYAPALPRAGYRAWLRRREGPVPAERLDSEPITRL